MEFLEVLEQELNTKQSENRILKQELSKTKQDLSAVRSHERRSEVQQRISSGEFDELKQKCDVVEDRLGEIQTENDQLVR